MAKFVNNEPKFKVGDKVVYSRRRDFIVGWEEESIDKGPLTISKVDTFYRNDELIDVNYFVDGLGYVYSEDWLDYAPVGPKFKIGDLVRINNYGDPLMIHDIITKTYANGGRAEYYYEFKLKGGAYMEFHECRLTPATPEETLIHDLEICGGENGCEGCSRDRPDGGGNGCDKLELDAAELIKKLQKKVKELEEEKK